MRASRLPLMALFALLVALDASSAAAARLVLGMETRDGASFFAREADLRAGEQVRFERSRDLPGKGRARVTLIVEIRSESGNRIELSVAGRIRSRDGGAAMMTHRVYELRRGETVSFFSEPDGSVRFVVALADELEGAGGELPGVELRMSVRLDEVAGSERRELARRRLRLAGPEATEVVLDSPAGSGPILTLRLVPIARSDTGAVVDLELESAAGPGSEAGRTIHADRLELGWDDAIRIGGLRGPRGEVVVVLTPER